VIGGALAGRPRRTALRLFLFFERTGFVGRYLDIFVCFHIHVYVLFYVHDCVLETYAYNSCALDACILDALHCVVFTHMRANVNLRTSSFFCSEKKSVSNHSCMKCQVLNGGLYTGYDLSQ
jgi:hypothetical protein